MTDTNAVRNFGPVRGYPVTLEPNVFDLIAADRADLLHNGTPSLRRIAQMSGVNHQRLAEAAQALKEGGDEGPYPNVRTIGSVAHAYGVVHKVDDKTALAAVLRIARPACAEAKQAA